MLSLLTTILELIPLGVIVVKRGGKIVLANGCGTEILSGSPGLSVPEASSSPAPPLTTGH